VQFGLWYQQEWELAHCLGLVWDCEALGSFLGGEMHGIYSLPRFCLTLSAHSPKRVYQEPLPVLFQTIEIHPISSRGASYKPQGVRQK